MKLFWHFRIRRDATASLCALQSSCRLVDVEVLGVVSVDGFNGDVSQLRLIARLEKWIRILFSCMQDSCNSECKLSLQVLVALANAFGLVVDDYSARNEALRLQEGEEGLMDGAGEVLEELFMTVESKAL